MVDEPKISNGASSDEDLVTAAQAGDPAALDILCQRYYEHIYYFILKHTLIKEPSLVEDIRQEVFLTIFKLIKSRDFIPQGAGSFKAYLFTTARNICWTQTRREAKEPEDIYGALLELIPEKSFPEPLEVKGIQTELKSKLLKVLTRLSPEEQKLLYYLSEGTPYKDILADPIFAEYSLAYLKLKIYNTRQKAQKLFMEDNDEEEK